MKKIQRQFRANYEGEEVVTSLVHSGAEWQIGGQFVPNAVINNQISNRACVIGNGISRKGFNLTPVFKHAGGLLGRKKLQTYGCNALYRDHTPDFLVVTGDSATIVKEVADSGYCDKNIVYATAADVQNFPGKFYLTPQDPGWNAGSVATLTAAFDGHKVIYMLGFDSQDTPGYNYNMYAGTNGYQPERGAQAGSQFSDATLKTIFNTYPEVDFVRVMPSKSAAMPELWKDCTNLRQISIREFVLEADL